MQRSPQQFSQYQMQAMPTQDMHRQFRGLSDYDYGGGFLTSVNAMDGMPHFSDIGKLPQHHTFSNESAYANPSAGHWDGNNYMPSAIGNLYNMGKSYGRYPMDQRAYPMKQPMIDGPIFDQQTDQTQNPGMVLHALSQLLGLGVNPQGGQ